MLSGMALFPNWLHIFSSATLMLGVLCATVILVDVRRHPPEMVIMGRVWPICALFGTVAVVWLYFRYGRGTGEPSKRSKSESPHAGKAAERQPFPVIVSKGTLHCGAGCTLGDIMAEWLAYALPVAAIVFGWHWLFGEKTCAVWTLDFFFAFGFGIVFQYFAIVPMRHLPPGEGILAALKADALSLTAWQVGMYFTMGCVQHVFQASFGGRAPVDSVEFWGAMQLAMLGGFVTSYPMNWWLIRTGIKEAM